MVTGPATQAAWKRIQNRVRERVGEHRFNTWLRDVHLINLDDHLLELGIQNRFHAEYIEDSYREVLLDAVEEAVGVRPDLKFTISGFLFRRHRAHQEQLKEQASKEVKRRQARQKGKSTKAGTGEAKPKRGKTGTETSQVFFLKHRLDDFIVGDSNKLAYSQAKRAIRSPGADKINPLVIYGGHGLGKTHLLQGIARGLQDKYDRNPDHGHYSGNGKPRVLYVTCEYFINRFTTEVRSNRMQQFRDEFRTPAALIVDDIHHLAGKPATSEAFLHTMVELLDLGAQIIVSSLQHPSRLKGLPKALINRLEGGMATRIGDPDRQTRSVLIKALLGPEKRHYPQGAINLLADRLTGSIREIKGHLNKLVAFLDVSGEEVSRELVAQILADLIEFQTRHIDLADIENAIIARQGVTSQQLHSASRKREVATARQICMYLARQLTDYSLNEIGRYFGGKNHATVVFSEKKIRKAMETNDELRRNVEELQALLTQGKNGKP